MPESLPLGRRGRIAVVVVAVVVVLLVLVQLVAPRIAEHEVRSRLGDGRANVSVSAFPAEKLAFEHFDRVDVEADDVEKSDDAFAKLVRGAQHVAAGHVRIVRLRVGQVVMHDVDARLDHGRVRASARFDLDELSALVPGGGRLAPLAPSSSGAPRFLAQVSVLGVTQQVPVVVSATDGTVQAAPEGLLGGAVQITVFSNPALRIDGVTGTVDGGAVRLTVTGEIA